MKSLKSLTSLFLTSLIACTGPLMAAQKKQIVNPCNTDLPLNPPHVTLGCPNYIFNAHFTGQALQAFANNLDYAAEALPFNYGDSQPAVSPSWSIPQIPSDFHFGFDVGVVGVFQNINSNILANWQYFHSPNDTDSLTVASSTYMVGPFFEIGPDASAYKKSVGKAKFHFDEVNLDYGTFVDFGQFLQMNLFAGVGFNRIVEHRFTKFSSLSGNPTRTITVPASFIGAGPQLGTNFNYKIAKGFQFTGQTRATLLVGTFANSTTFSTLSEDLVDLGDINPNVQTIQVDNQSGLVPAFEGKLGFSYEYLYRSRYNFKIEAGYQAQVYINAIRTIDMGSEVALGTVGSVESQLLGVYARTFERVVSDFSLAGPYATASFEF